MYKDLLKKMLPHALAIAFFIVLSFTYFSPMFQGKALQQHDLSTFKGMSQEVRDFKEKTGENSLWTNSMFGGMPTYLITGVNQKNIFSVVSSWVHLKMQEPASHLFLYLLGFYLSMLAFKVKPWLAVSGAVGFAFSSYFFVIIAAGHITKAIAIGYMAPVIAGVYLAFDRKPVAGAVMMAFFLALQILTSHMQIVYYTLLTVLIFGIVWLIKAIKEKQYLAFIKATLASVVGVILAVGVNATVLYLTYEYGKDSIRGKSELTHDQGNKTSGLDKDYATAWSYGIGESFTLLIPDFKGGASGGSLSTNSETYKLFEQAQGKVQAKKIIKQLPLYWGEQPGTSGPVYVGAIICFLFVLGLFWVKGPMKWWLLAATILSLLLSWGKNFMGLTSFFLDYFPGYNKFRTVTMILVIAEFAMPLLGILGLVKLFSGEVDANKFKKGMIWAFGITGGLSLFFALFSGIFSYQSASDSGMQQVLVDALRTDRQALLRGDAFRSFLFIAVAAILIALTYFKKLDKKYFYPALIVLLLLDMWPVNKRYLNDGNFATKKVIAQEFTPTSADQFITKDKDPDFRVLNLTVSTFNDATTSYFHKSIGGYHGAKMRRYQELIDFQIMPEIQQIIQGLQDKSGNVDPYALVSKQPVLNMLNTKYIIINPEAFPVYNSGALGNAWFVQRLKQVASADDEIHALSDFDPKLEAVVDSRFSSELAGFSPVADTTATILLDTYKPNYLKYSSNAKEVQLAVFSEIYYAKGWNAFIDGKPAKHFRADYVLRAMIVPAGKHTIEYRFEPKAYAIGNMVSYFSSVLLLLFILGMIIWPFVSKKKAENNS